MNIQKAAKEAIEYRGSFYRKTTMCCGENISEVITSTESPCYTCEIVLMGNGVPGRMGKDWFPSMDDLTADDWYVLKPNASTEKDVIRENSKGVEGTDVPKMTIQEAAKEAMECKGVFYRKTTIYEPSGRCVVVMPDSERIPASAIIIVNGEPVCSCRHWAPTAYDLIADDWSVLSGLKIRNKGNNGENNVFG